MARIPVTREVLDALAVESATEGRNMSTDGWEKDGMIFVDQQIYDRLVLHARPGESWSTAILRLLGRIG